MIARRTIPLALLALFALQLSASPAAPPRPRLNVWGCTRYEQCQAFARDFAGDPEFAAALRSKFDVHVLDACALLNQPARIARGIRCLPTFERSDFPSRVEGYRGKRALLIALEIVPPDRPQPAGQETSPPATMPPSPSPPAARLEADAIRDQLAAIQASAAKQQTSADQLRALFTDALARQQTTLQQVREQLAAHAPHAADLARIRAAIADVQQRLTLTHTAPPAVSPAPQLDRASAETHGPAARPLLRFGRFALSAVELAGIVGLTLSTGGSGALAWTLGKLAVGAIIRRRRARREARAPSPAPASGSTLAAPADARAAPAPAAPFAPTNFAPYPVDRISAAYDYAKRHVADRYPGAVATLEMLDALMSQHLSGQAAASSLAR